MGKPTPVPQVIPEPGLLPNTCLLTEFTWDWIFFHFANIRNIGDSKKLLQESTKRLMI